MRVSSATSQLDIAPGQSADITLDIVNTGTVIDGITADVVGLPSTTVTTHPAVLPLFPDTAGQMTVTVGLPPTFPAGRHPVTVEVRSRQPDTEPAYANLDLTVPRKPAVGLTSRPALVRARRAGRFIITVANRGNVLLDVNLSVQDPEKVTTVLVQPPLLSLPPGASAEAVVTVRTRRMFMGSDNDHGLLVQATARPADDDAVSEPDQDAAGGPATDDGNDEDSGVLTAAQPITFRQRPYVSRGAMTAVILAAIVALWAGVFLFGLSRVFASDPLTKTAPASYFAATSQSQQASPTGTGALPPSASAGATPGTDGAAADPSAAEGAGPGGGSDPGSAPGSDPGSDPGSGGSGDGAGDVAAGPAADAVPAGALRKDGTLPAGVGGTISGTVTAASSGQPVGRILVEALRVKKDGSTVPTSSAATQADGSYQVAGLFPGPYLLRFSAPGFVTSYFPAAADPASAETLTATSGEVTAGGDAVVTGKPATISGHVDPGDASGKVTTTVSARLLQQGPGQDIVIDDVTTDPGDHSYTFTDLPAPGNYQLTFSTDGYENSTVTTTVTGGAQRFESTVVLSAGGAQISGTVTDGTKALGGATVSTTVGGKTVTTGTPTEGDVGHFVLGNLPTPATYVVTVSKDGYGQSSQVIDLAPGEPQDDLTITLRSGTDVVTGTLVDPADKGIGGATVTVGGLADAPSTVTLTDGTIGSFRLTGLPSPGSYTLTFSHPGYLDQTVPVTLEANTPPAPLTVTMAASVGSITGSVSAPDGQGLAGATVTATDGQKSWPVITTSSGSASQIGSYTIADLPAGIYTVTASQDGRTSQTTIATVDPGKPVTLAFVLEGGG